MTNAKRERTIDMTQGKFLRLVLRFSIPLLIGSIFQQIYSVVDTVVAGYVLGDGAIAAIGSTGSLYGLIIQLSGGLAGGFVLVITRCFGAKEPGRLRRAIASTFALSGGITLIMTIISLLFLRQFMVLMDTPESILKEAYSYMLVICAGLLATVGHNIFSGIMRAFGNSFTPLCILIFSSLLNIGLDLLFVAVFHMSVAGVAHFHRAAGAFVLPV
ncbi:hypothetical protein D7X94_14165 [Acutalibacter sp. 1XD8-33]|uniref:MATE family efflux transporter n=1 Tax=Acutalibacter sp. 1XD8-33 TaxID=2320081 RepID=UPI000EA01647|nr:hypothetical protein D7X94_14165 [Acutalibacter sp. 1XD8-33]